MTRRQPKLPCALVASAAAALLLRTAPCGAFSAPSPLSATTTAAFDELIVSSANGNVATTSTTTAPKPKRPPTPLSFNQRELDEQSPKFPRTWVPIASVCELDPDRPTPVSFMGQSYVIYKAGGSDDGDESDTNASNQQQWVVMDDACPHRLAPLSEGRIETNAASGERRLQCSYHGWEFDADGTCQNIPQVAEAAQARAVQDARCHVKSYSTLVENNLVFVWPWSDDPIQAALDNPKLVEPSSMLDGVSTIVSTYTRDLPYSWDTLVENLIDPAHVPFAHHGLQGTRDDALPINMTNPITEVAKEGFQLEFDDRTMEMDRKGWADFKAPYVLTYSGVYQTDNPLRRFFNLTTVCLPTKPGWSRVIILVTLPTQSTSSEDGGKKSPSFMSRLFKLIPIWAVHQLTNRFLDSDLAFLHYQEQERERRGGDAEDPYFMPAQADRAINAFRRWKTEFASVLLPLPPAIYDRRVLFDRYAQHTDHCKHCQQGLKSVRKMKLYATGVLALSVLLAATKLPLLGSLIAACSLGFSQLLKVIEKSFFEGEFKHYENN